MKRLLVLALLFSSVAHADQDYASFDLNQCIALGDSESFVECTTETEVAFDESDDALVNCIADATSIDSPFNPENLDGIVYESQDFQDVLAFCNAN